MGNGDLLVYGQGPNIMQVFGPVYTGPSFLSLSVSEPETEIQTESVREPGTAVWRHAFFGDNAEMGCMTDYILPETNVFVREYEFNRAVRFRLAPAPVVYDCLDDSQIDIYSWGAYFGETRPGSSALLLRSLRGNRFGKRLTTSRESNLIFLLDGAGEMEPGQDGSYEVRLLPGHGQIVMGCCFSCGDAVQSVKDYLSRDDQPLEEVRAYWREYMARRRDFMANVSLDCLEKDRILEAADSVGVLMKCQQSRSGGVMAGHRYCFAYIRDMTGVLRGFLALGYLSEARAILEYWLRLFGIYGDLLDAEGMGDAACRLPWFNDEVEITSYLILDFFKYCEYNPDDALLEKAFPLMRWAFEAQLSHLAGGMLEFNSDETFMAGGVIPNWRMYDGSSEATMLFIVAGEKLLAWARANNALPSDVLNRYEGIVVETKTLYRKNFVHNGRLIANNPARRETAAIPEFRFSHCEAPDCVKGRNVLITWTERNPQGLYLCPRCRDKAIAIDRDMEKIYVLNSVITAHLYMGSGLFSNDEIRMFLQPAREKFIKNGLVSSDMDGARSLGHDYGVFLYNLARLSDPLATDVLRTALDVLDDTSAWVEYYDDNVPANCCKCRPWESAVNMEAIILFLETYGAPDGNG